jgi:hypothetical protein
MTADKALRRPMKTFLILSGLLSMTLGVTAQLPPATTNISSGIGIYAPSLTHTQRVVQIRRAEFRALLSTNTPVRLGPSRGLPELHRVPWQEPRRDLHLLDQRIQPVKPGSIK